jgi:Mannitol/fructose-specific phosphotransferase system, IIA domain
MNRLILNEDNVLLNVAAEPKYDAIERVGKLLVQNGYAEEGYIEGMKERERDLTTYIGNGISIPHGMPDYIKYIKKSGIVVAQYPEGVDFGGGNTAYILIGIAGQDNEHVDILSNIALVCQYQENVDKLREAKTKAEIIKILTDVQD